MDEFLEDFQMKQFVMKLKPMQNVMTKFLVKFVEEFLENLQ